jgi:transposase
VSPKSSRLGAPASRSPQVHRLATTIEAWWPAVQAGITTGYSNARSWGYLPLAGAGYNRLAKHQARNAFGMRRPRFPGYRIH